MTLTAASTTRGPVTNFLHDGMTGTMKGAVAGGLAVGTGFGALALMSKTPIHQAFTQTGGAILVGSIGGALVGAVANAMFPPTPGQATVQRMLQSAVLPAIAGAGMGLAATFAAGILFAGMGGGKLPASISLAVIGTSAITGAVGGAAFGALGVIDG